VLANGPPRLIARDAWPAERTFIVLSPQHPGGGCPSADEIDAFIGWAEGAYHVDAKRVFVTGLSCGAIGAWSYLDKYLATDVAAALLIAGQVVAQSAGCSGPVRLAGGAGFGRICSARRRSLPATGQKREQADGKR